MSIALEAALSSSVPFPFHSGPVPQPFELALTPEFIQQTRVRAQNYKPALDLNNGSDSEWSDGPPTKAMSSLAKYWAEDFDSRCICFYPGAGAVDFSFSYVRFSCWLRGLDMALDAHRQRWLCILVR